MPPPPFVSDNFHTAFETQIELGQPSAQIPAMTSETGRIWTLECGAKGLRDLTYSSLSKLLSPRSF